MTFDLSVRFRATVVVGVAGAAALSTLGLFGWAPAEWRTFSTATRNGVLLPAIAVSAAVARLGTLTRPRNVVLGVLTTRTPAEVFVRQWRPMLVYAVIGYCLGTLPALIVTAARAQYGSLDLLDYAVNIMALIALTTFALAVSHLLRHRLNLLLVPLCTLLLILAPAIAMQYFQPSDRSLLLPAFAWLNDMPWLGYRQTLYTSAFRLGYFSLFAATLAVVGLGAIAWRRPLASAIRSTIFRTTVGLGLALAASTSTAIIASPPLIEPDLARPVCSSDRNITVCLHPAQQALGADILQAARRIDDTVTESSAAPVTFLQEGTFAPTGSEPLPLPWLNLDSEGEFKRELVFGFARLAAGTHACGDKRSDVGLSLAFDLESSIEARANDSFTPQGPPLTQEQWRAAVEESHPGDIFSAMSNDAFKSWYSVHRAEILDCTYVDDLLNSP